MKPKVTAESRPRTARTGSDLLDIGVVEPQRAAQIDEVRARFSMAVPPHLAKLIDTEDPEDPIARQFVPAMDELVSMPGELGDPIGDVPHSPVKGIVHRYPDRVLLKAVHVCPVYCRFCFRREQVGAGGEVLSPAELAAALDYVRSHEKIWEVILSGGDPLVMSSRRLDDMMTALNQIPHVAVIRLHTKFPVADPARIDDELVRALKKQKAVYVVLHCNHARELTDEAVRACARLVDSGIPVLSQSVLLRGVNDSVEALEELLRALVRSRIKPYYLHHLDLAQGTSHFRTTIEHGRALMRALRGRLSGLCQVNYVLDIPGGHGKVPIGPGYIECAEDGYVVEDFCGNRHAYREPRDHDQTEK